MANDNDDLDKLSLNELRDLKEELRSRIDAAGVQTGDFTQGIEGSDEIRGCYDLLREIEARLNKYEKGAS